jgi:molybdopterin converting factor small subunit
VATASTSATAGVSPTAAQVLTVRYFAWVREKVGRADERIEVPASVATVGDLVAWPASCGRLSTRRTSSPRKVWRVRKRSRSSLLSPAAEP